jgi:acyl-homoserine lactone acylase PvdQ
MKPYPWYFTIDGRPVKVVGDGDVHAMDPRTGAIRPDVAMATRIRTDANAAHVDDGLIALSHDEFRARLDALRQPILERFATAPLSWTWSGDVTVGYRTTFDGHDLAVRSGDFPEEAMYLVTIDGEELYELDGWPSAWSSPST